jgi:hypothetical protein
MEQHPIPQQISSYQFRLVGDMTLKQFFQLAGGLLVALLIYSTPIIGIVKWPFVILSALLGAALAFMPLEERPLEKWIFAFFSTIYAPTQFYWKKTVTPIKYFADEPQSVAPANAQDQALQEYLSSPGQKSGASAKLEGAEKGFLNALTNMFSGGIPKPAAPQPVAPPSPPVVPIVAQPTPTPPAPVAATAPPEPPKELKIPETPNIKIVSNIPHLVVEEKPRESSFAGPQITTQQVAPIIAGNEIVSTKQAMYSIDAAPPNPPTIPNVVVGQVVDETRRIIEGAIMEIRDAYGRPIRALRSNKAGHFMTVTPLENGRYDVMTEKEGYQFTPVHFEATGGLIPPILVSGKKSFQPEVMVNSQAQSQNPSLNP